MAEVIRYQNKISGFLETFIHQSSTLMAAYNWQGDFLLVFYSDITGLCESNLTYCTLLIQHIVFQFSLFQNN